MAGILQFDAGEICIDGKSIRTEPLACKRELAYIPDNPDLYDFMSGIKYLNFIADIFGVSADDRQARIRDYAARFELTEDLAQPIAAYSHGMKQKLAIIAAWLHQPKLVIMDEPFVGLDPKASHLLKGMMRELCDRGGAIFFSTHVLEVAEKLCDKVSGVGTVAGCYVQDGKLQRKDCQVRLIRDGIVIHEGVLASLQRFKDSVKEVAAGYECGLSIEKFNDIKEGDIVEAFTMEQIEV